MKPRRFNRRIRRRLFTQRLEERRLLAGPYAPAAGQVGSTAIAMDDPSIVGWATEVAQYVPGTHVDVEFQTPGRALGPAEGSAADVVSLGRGGTLTLGFADPIRDGLGFDFAVFENSLSDTFLELGFVEVSSNGNDFFRFPSDSLVPEPVPAFGAVDPTEIDQLAGKYRAGFGTPFDLSLLDGVNPRLDVTHVTHVRLVDVVGDGSALDASGDPIYDPFPTLGSAGLDVDAVAVMNSLMSVGEVIGFEDVGATLPPASAFSGPVAGGTPITGPFNDQVVVGEFASGSLIFNNAYSLDFGSWNQFAYSNQTDTVTAGFANQFSSFAGSGASGSSTFAVGFPDQGSFYDPPTIRREPGDQRRFESVMITNTTYAAISMRDGDSFAKKFGGETGNDEDYFFVSITGKDVSGNPIDTIDFYLADYRFADNSLDYIVDQWVEVDLGSIAMADTIEFAIISSDNGTFGINTPAFFAMDDIKLVEPVLPLDLADRVVDETAGIAATIARVSRPDADTSDAVNVSITPVDSSIANVPTSVTIPVGERFVEFPIGVLDNDRFHGTRTIVIEASAPGWVTSSQTLTINDDEVQAIKLTLPTTIDEGQSGSATVQRNDADLTSPLVVNMESSDPTLLSVPSTVTIPAGQASANFSVTAIENAIHQADRGVQVTASSGTYSADDGVVLVVNNDLPALSIDVGDGIFDESDGVPDVRFEDVGSQLAPESFYNGSDGAGQFVSDGVTFNNDFDPTFGSWSGWSFSNTSDTTTAGFTNQYSAIVGRGSLGSDTYAIASTYGTPRVLRDPATHGEFQSIDFTNSTYAALSMMEGDAFAKKFGGETGDDPDFFLLTIEGWNATAESVGTVEFYLADYRFADNSLDYIIDQWTTVDVSSLTGAVALTFALSSSDVGQFGMNTPAYFAADRFTFTDSRPPQGITVSRNTEDVSEALVVNLNSSDTTEVQLRSSIRIPAGKADVFVPLSIVNDALVDSSQFVNMQASAAGFVSATHTVQVNDDDQPRLNLSLSVDELLEGAAGRAVVHRNVVDVADPLTVTMDVDLSSQIIVAPIVIPAGDRSVEFQFSAVDNDVVDADRTVSLTASAGGFASDAESLLIRNEDVPPPPLTLAIDPNRVRESGSTTVATATVHRGDVDLNQPVDVLLTADLASEVTIPASVTIPSGSDQTTFSITAVDDDLADGDREVTITATAIGFAESSASVTVEDDDVPTITLSLVDVEVTESAGNNATQLIVHRNSFDVSQSLVVDLSLTGAGVTIPQQIQIPSNQVSTTVDISTLDNSVLDGDRTVSFHATSDGFVSTSAQLKIVDDEVAGIHIQETDGDTIVSEWRGTDELLISLASQPLADVVIDVQLMGNDVELDRSQLSFSSQNWNDSQSVTITGVPDLVIDPETITIRFVVDGQSSHPSYGNVEQSAVVTVVDVQPDKLAVVEDGEALQLIDSASGIVIIDADRTNGLTAIANSLPQTVELHALQPTTGPVTIDTAGGDDNVWLRDTSFTMLAGGDDFDQLWLRLSAPVEFVDLISNRVTGFEEYQIANDNGATVWFDTARLDQVTTVGDPVVIRVHADQDLRFHGAATMLDPVTHGDSFAQVITDGTRQIRVISELPWQNALSRWDVNYNGEVTALDALAGVNQLARITDPQLPSIQSADQFGGSFFDVSGDGRLTALDPLQVINEIARRSNAAEFESPAIAGMSEMSAREISVDEVAVKPLPTRSTKVIGMPSDIDQAIEALYETPGQQSEEASFNELGDGERLGDAAITQLSDR